MDSLTWCSHDVTYMASIMNHIRGWIYHNFSLIVKQGFHFKLLSHREESNKVHFNKSVMLSLSLIKGFILKKLQASLQVHKLCFGMRLLVIMCTLSRTHLYVLLPLNNYDKKHPLVKSSNIFSIMITIIFLVVASCT